MTNPWLVGKSVNLPVTEEKQLLNFEDNFNPRDPCLQPELNKEIGLERLVALPDSEAYLQGLERKLAKIKKQTNIVEALSLKREDCMRELLKDNSNSGPNYFENDLSTYDTPITSTEIQRQLQPVQPLTVGEVVHIVEHDHLEQQRIEESSIEEGKETISKQ